MKIISTTLILSVLFISNTFGQYDANQNKWFTDIKKALENPERVYNLDLSNQNLNEIPSSVNSFSNLKALKLSDNNLNQINDNLSQLRNLEFLELSGNQFFDINFDKLKNLKYSLDELWLRDNKIIFIDSTINVLESLSILNVGNNNIEKFDTAIRLNKLQVLQLDKNRIGTIPDFVNYNSRLRILNLNGNKLNEFVLNSKLQRLEYLNLGDNPIGNLSLVEGGKLETLILDWVELNNFNLNELSATINYLSLEHCKLTDIKNIAHLRNLRELSLIHNNISVLPIEILNLKKLRKIWIIGNMLKSEYSLQNNPRLTVIE